MPSFNFSTTPISDSPFAFLRWRIKGIGRNIACLGVDLGPDRQLASNFSRDEHGSELASNLTVILTSVSNTDSTYNSPWDTARPEDNVFDLEVETLLLDREEFPADETGNASLRIDAVIGRSEKSACAEWQVRVRDDDSAKPVVDVKVETDISDETPLAVDDEIRINVAAQHRHRAFQENDDDDGEEDGTKSNETSMAEAKSLKLGFYLPP